MATAETVEIGLAHPPMEDSLKAFKHEPEYFQAVSNLSDHQLTNFSPSDLKEVRLATSAYGKHLFGKVLLPDSQNAYFMFRAFIPGDADTARLHCIHLEEIEKPDGDKVFKAIFGKDDKLEWFDV
ncbi:Uncharacterized protein BP5553_02111 [Venustampulla echinocandica]|uniref:Uncharacterized protein n=1 Tax=Venustampulla echinocandica TaxID=2656787 RepID=A0A370U2X5_9HELO|nr:Uncharacterized protein BP5553_02111 [Venustampulla echinocandica]RDL42132.1 Uncharacterized protein BP5553_02111 [Venustampulla echinocandica]